MTKRELMIKAHKMTKEIKTQYPTINYKFQLGLCLSYLQKEGEIKMVELKGTEKQVKWANEIRDIFCKVCDELNLKYSKIRYLESYTKAENWINNYKQLSYKNYSIVKDMVGMEELLAQKNNDIEHYEYILDNEEMDIKIYDKKLLAFED